jgi:hypothetical protein
MAVIPKLMKFLILGLRFPVTYIGGFSRGLLQKNAPGGLNSTFDLCFRRPFAT